MLAGYCDVFVTNQVTATRYEDDENDTGAKEFPALPQLARRSVYRLVVQRGAAPSTSIDATNALE